jgi:hypothetical protein
MKRSFQLCIVLAGAMPLSGGAAAKAPGNEFAKNVVAAFKPKSFEPRG